MYQYVPYRSSSESQRYFPVLPFLAGLAVSPLIFGGYGGGYGGYGPSYGPIYGPHYGPSFGPSYGPQFGPVYGSYGSSPFY
ncbi:penicillin-binding protein [Thalassorhabdus alkalitolerans]|uniref:Penicillin-binding protein n=1 Tax=Thalassorhabdus alkalitolerans TaxID=2282697 RepID=A0ABW0YJE0_9BACI